MYLATWLLSVPHECDAKVQEVESPMESLTECSTLVTSCLVNAPLESTMLDPITPCNSVVQQVSSIDTRIPPVNNTRDLVKLVKTHALPIEECRADILSLVQRSPILVLTGDTGSGKSTQLAQV